MAILSKNDCWCFSKQASLQEKNFDVEWDVELYGELLSTGGGKERMTRYFKDYNPDAWILEDCSCLLMVHPQPQVPMLINAPRTHQPKIIH